MEQWHEEIQKHLEVPGGIGLIQGAILDWQRPIVLATYHTLAERAATLPEEVRRWFGTIVWDEAHHISAPTFSRTADLFYGKRIGLTATVTRVDGTHVIYNFHLGEVVYKDLQQELKPEIFFYWTGLEVDIADPQVQSAVCDINKELHISKLATYFGQWRSRIDLILDEVKKAERQGRKILVLSYSIDELVNMFAIWSGAQNLYTEVPYPTPQDVGEILPPSPLSDKNLARSRMKIGELSRRLSDPKLHPAQVSMLRLHRDSITQRIQQHEVWKKCEAEYGKRQMAFLRKTLVANKSNAGIMIGDIKPTERMQMLRDKQVVFSIMKYGREGLDEASLNTIFVCEPFSQKNGLQQLMGRVLRPSAGSKARVVVFFEDNIGPIIGMCSKLRKHLNHWPLEEGGPFTYSLVNHPRKGSRKTWATL
jgi:hypothetical protein